MIVLAGRGFRSVRQAPPQEITHGSDQSNQQSLP